MKLKRMLALVLAVALVLSIAGCGKKAEGLSVCLASEPETLDPALNASLDGATMIVHLFSGLAKWDKEGNIAADCAVELPEGVRNEDGTYTYTYTLKDNLKWSDGQPLKASDFVYAWKRAAASATGADYGYMFQVIKGYPDNLAAEAVDDKTIVVTVNNYIGYWNELLAFPTYMPVREDVVANESWATDASTYVCNGPYSISSWKHNSVITLTKNENYHEADAITMPQLNCYLSDDDNAMLANYKSGNWHMIDSIPQAELKTVQETMPDEFKAVGQLGTYFICWNVNEDLLPNSTLTGVEKERAAEEVRRALMLVLNRDYITTELTQAGEVPAASFVSMDLTDADGVTEFRANAGHNEEFDGYFDLAALDANLAEAKEILKKYYPYDEATDTIEGPSVTYIYNTDSVHAAVAEYIQDAFKKVGVEIQLENMEWSTFLDTRNKGQFTVARHGWVADYNDPITFLDMWLSTSGNNDAQLGKDAHAELKAYSLDLTPYGYDIVVENGTWAETYDVLIKTVQECEVPETRYALMHLAEDMIMSTGCITPLHYYTDPYLIKESVQGCYTNKLGYKYFMYTTISE